MLEYLQHLLDHSSTPVLSAVILGLMTAISPCPLATNITAIGYISKDVEDKKRIFYNGLFYTLGRIVSYTTLGIILYFGANAFHVGGFFQVYGEKILGPFLILVGILMFDRIKIRIPGLAKFFDRFSDRQNKQSRWSAFVLGILFALAFCPYSGLLYFGALIPISIASPSGLLLPVVFAIVTGLPVIIVAWILAFSVSGIGRFYNKLTQFGKWFRMVVALLFIGVGIYYCFVFLIRI